MNKERLERISSLRQKGLTIDQIAKTTGYPRSSVGYIVGKYCGGKAGRLVRVDSLVRQWVAEATLTRVPEHRIDRIEEYMQRIEEKERPKIGEIPSGKKSGNLAEETLIMDRLLKDPERLYTRLRVLAELIRFAPFLKIDMDSLREILPRYLTTGN